MQSSAALLVSTIGLILDGVFIFFTLRMIIRSHQSKNWPTTQGKMLDIGIVKGNNSDGETIFMLRCKYCYTVNDRIFYAGRLSYGQSDTVGKSDNLQQILKRYPAGQEINVYYNPEDPQTAIIEPGYSQSLGLQLLIEAVLFIVIMFFASKATH